MKGEGVGRLHWTSGVLHSRGLRFEPCSEQYFVCINPPLCHALWWDSRQSFLVPRKKGQNACWARELQLQMQKITKEFDVCQI